MVLASASIDTFFKKYRYFLKEKERGEIKNFINKIARSPGGRVMLWQRTSEVCVPEP